MCCNGTCFFKEHHWFPREHRAEIVKVVVLLLCRIIRILTLLRIDVQSLRFFPEAVSGIGTYHGHLAIAMSSGGAPPPCSSVQVVGSLQDRNVISNKIHPSAVRFP